MELLPGLGYGLKAVARLSQHEKVCVIPNRFCMVASGEHALETITSQLRRERLLCRHASLSEQKQQQQSCFFQPFLDVLPDDVSFLPSMYSASNLALLEGSSLAEDARRMKAQWLAFYDESIAGTAKESSLADGIYSDEPLSAEPSVSRSLMEVNVAKRLLKAQWLWARATLQCRAYSFKLSSDRWQQLQAEGYDYGSDNSQCDLVAFIPFVGFANHDDRKCCKVSLGNGISDPVSSFVLHTTDVYHADEPVCISYGDLSFNQKVLSFGWIDTSYGGDGDGAAPHPEQAFSSSTSHPSSSLSSSLAVDDSPLRFHITPIDVKSGSIPQLEKEKLNPLRQVEIRTNVFHHRHRLTEHHHQLQLKLKGRPVSKLMSTSMDEDGRGMSLKRQVEQLIQSFINGLTGCSRESAIRTIRDELTRRQDKYTAMTHRLRASMSPLLNSTTTSSSSSSSHDEKERAETAPHDLTVEQALLIVTVESNSVQSILTELREH